MPTVLEKYLKENPNINEIHLHLDNDEVAWFSELYSLHETFLSFFCHKCGAIY